MKVQKNFIDKQNKTKNKKQIKELEDLLFLIRFTEKISIELSKAVEREDIFKILNNKFKNLKSCFIAALYMLSDDKKGLILISSSISKEKEKAIQKLLEVKVNDFVIPVDKSATYRNVIENNQVIEVNRLKILHELFPKSKAPPLCKILGLKTTRAILAPIKFENKVIGVISVSSPELYKAFIPSVNNLASHISSTLERCKLLEDITTQKQAESALRKKLSFEKTITSISARFLNVPEINSAINNALADIGTLSGAARS